MKAAHVVCLAYVLAVHYLYAWIFTQTDERDETTPKFFKLPRGFKTLRQAALRVGKL